jgi:hypothetical protein
MAQEIATMVQAIAALIAAVIAAIAAYQAYKSRRTAENIEKKLEIRQARLDERDLIGSDNGFLIPIEMDDMWRDYYNYRTNSIERGEASKKTENMIPSSTPGIVSEPLST